MPTEKIPLSSVLVRTTPFILTTAGKILIELARMLRYRRLVNMLSCKGSVLMELWLMVNLYL